MRLGTHPIAWDDLPEGQRLGQVPPYELAKALGCSPWSVYRAMRARGIKMPTVPRIAPCFRSGRWPSDRELRRQNEAEGEQSLRDAGARCGIGAETGR